VPPPESCKALGGECQQSGQTCTGPISGASDCPGSCYTSCIIIVPGSCSIKAFKVNDTTGGAEVTDGVSGFDRTNWYFGTSSNPPYIGTNTSKTDQKGGLSPDTYYYGAERWSTTGNPTGKNCGTGSFILESAALPPGGETGKKCTPGKTTTICKAPCEKGTGGNTGIACKNPGGCGGNRSSFKRNGSTCPSPWVPCGTTTSKEDCRSTCTYNNCVSNNSCKQVTYKGNPGCQRISRCNFDSQCCSNSAPSAPSLTSPGNGSQLSTSTVTLSWNHNNQFGINCGGNNNQFQVFLEAGDSTPDNIVCTLNSSTKECNVTVSDNQTYFWKVRATNGAVSTDSATWAFTPLISVGAWFQVQDTDLANPGDLISRIPAQCSSSPSCTAQFNLSGSGGFPGVPAYGGGTADFGSGSVSGEGWLANSGYSGRRYDYDWFARLAPAEVFTDPASVITDSQISGGDLKSGYNSRGYIWHYRDGDLTINSTANLGNTKVILLVTGNLILNGRITLDDGKGFFATFTKGSINIDSGVSHPNNPALEGLFLADGSISTGSKNPTPDDRLYIRGALVGWSGINLQRDLDPNLSTGANNEEAAEFIEYAPDLIFTFPRDLLREGLVWREVAP